MRTLLGLAAGLAALAFTPPALGQSKYALGLFHFNVQYVAGGTLGFSFLVDPVLDQSHDETEDQIIVESFAPVLDMYSQHPAWGVDLEMQAYMLDVMAERHPAVLEKLRSMAKAGQVSVVSFHYSDQLFLAFPERDWEESQRMVQETFARHDVPLSRTVFCQEGQSSMAMAGRMADNGYRNMVWPKNLWHFQHGDFAAEPLYRFGDVFMVAGSKGVSYSDATGTIEVTWTFLDDGELLATGDANPYFPDLFVHDPQAVADYEQKLVDLEAQGFLIVTVDDYVEAIKDRVTPAEPPPLLDGTWQTPSHNVSKWLGTRGVWFEGERDNTVRTLNSIAHHELVAAEAAALAAGLDRSAQLDAAWRLLTLGEVTDASGINPFRGEIEYGISHSSEALRIARDVIREAKQEAGHDSVVIDPTAGDMLAATELGEPLGEPVEAPIQLLVDGRDRDTTVEWELVGPGHWRVAVSFQPGEEREVSVTFPGELVDEFITTRALADSEPVTYRRSDFIFDEFHLALPIGLVSLGSQRFLIEDHAHAHLAARITRDAGDVRFADQTLAPEDGVRWVFHLFEGSASDAVALANVVNARRKVLR